MLPGSVKQMPSGPLLKVSPPRPIPSHLTGAGNSDPPVSTPLVSLPGGELVPGRDYSRMTGNKTPSILGIRKAAAAEP